MLLRLCVAQQLAAFIAACRCYWHCTAPVRADGYRVGLHDSAAALLYDSAAVLLCASTFAPTPVLSSVPCSEASLAFLVEAFQDQDPALMKDVLTSFDVRFAT